MKPDNYDTNAIDSLMAGLSEVPDSQVASNLLANNEQLWWGGNNILNGAFGTGTTAAGNVFSDEQAMTVSTVYACLRAIAENLGSLPGLVYAQAAKQRNLDRGTIPWQLLHDEPNPEMDSMTFWELMATRQEARGNGFAEIERDGADNPIALWPIHNSRVQPWRIDGKIEWQISTDTIDPRSEQYRSYMIPDRNMLNICGFGGNGYLAPGTLPCAQEQVGFAIAVQQYGSSFFKQGGKPSGIVEMPGYIDDEDDRLRFRADLNTMHAGKENWNKLAVLWMGGKWKEMQYGPEQAQLISSSNFSDKRICQFFRVPPAIVQIYDDYKFTSVDAMLQSFVMTCLRPIAVRFERAVNRKVLKYRDGRGRLVDAFDGPKIFEFLLEALLRGDAKKQAETLEIKRRNGIINANEWRALDNDAPLPGDQGEHYILPGGFGRLDLIQGPGNKAEQKPDQSNQTNQTDQAKTQPAKSEQQLPAFDAKVLAEAIQQSNLLKPEGNQSRGGSVADVDSIAREMGAEVLAEAVERIGSVIRSEVARLNKLDDDAAKSAKLSAIKSKAKSLMVSAAVPAAKIFKRTDEWAGADVDVIANELASDALSKFFG